MAKQESFIKVRGKVGDLSFTKHRNRGYEVRQKGGVDRARILTDPNFQRTRENMSEFGAAAAKARQLRLQFNNLARGIADRGMPNRLTALVHRIQKMDSESPRGQRIFKNENSGLLKGFQVNNNSSLNLLFAQELKPTYDRASGAVSLSIESFNPQQQVLLLEGATHMQFVLAAARITQDDVFPRPAVERSGYIPLLGNQEGIELSLSLEPNLADVVYIMVGISMYQQVNEGGYQLNNSTYNALTIVDVDIP